MPTFDMLCVGEAVVDIFVKLSEENKTYGVGVEKNELLLPLGAKIPVASSAFSIGGNATHVAIGLSRLEFKTSLAAELGEDEFAEKILKDLKKENVETSLIQQVPNTQSTFNVSVSAGNDRTILVHHVEKEQNFSFEHMQAPWVFLSSMGERWEDAYKKTVDFVKKGGAKLAFNPGGTQLRKGIDSFIDVVKNSDVLFVNKEEAEMILYKEVLSKEKKESTESLLFRLQRMGPKVSVITDGENGSYALDTGNQVVMQKTFPVTPTEKTGAGDGFSAGFLAAMMLGKSLSDCLLWGTANATGVITKIGGQEGLLTRQELEHMIQQYK